MDLQNVGLSLPRRKDEKDSTEKKFLVTRDRSFTSSQTRSNPTKSLDSGSGNGGRISIDKKESSKSSVKTSKKRGNKQVNKSLSSSTKRSGSRTTESNNHERVTIKAMSKVLRFGNFSSILKAKLSSGSDQSNKQKKHVKVAEAAVEVQACPIFHYPIIPVKVLKPKAIVPKESILKGSNPTRVEGNKVVMSKVTFNDTKEEMLMYLLTDKESKVSNVPKNSTPSVPVVVTKVMDTKILLEESQSQLDTELKTPKKKRRSKKVKKQDAIKTEPSAESTVRLFLAPGAMHLDPETSQEGIISEDNLVSKKNSKVSTRSVKAKTPGPAKKISKGSSPRPRSAMKKSLDQSAKHFVSRPGTAEDNNNDAKRTYSMKDIGTKFEVSSGTGSNATIWSKDQRLTSIDEDESKTIVIVKRSPPSGPAIPITSDKDMSSPSVQKDLEEYQKRLGKYSEEVKSYLDTVDRFAADVDGYSEELNNFQGTSSVKPNSFAKFTVPLVRQPIPPNCIFNAHDYIIKVNGPVIPGAYLTTKPTGFLLEINMLELDVNPDSLLVEDDGNVMSVVIPCPDNDEKHFRIIRIAVPSRKKLGDLKLDEVKTSNEDKYGVFTIEGF